MMMMLLLIMTIMIAMMVLMAMMAMVVLMADDADKGDDIAYHSFQVGEEGAHTRVTSRGSVLGASCFKLYWASQKPHIQGAFG